MNRLSSISFKGYKVFPKDEHTRIDRLSRVNVIIGKNNSGKTSLLDIVEMIYDGKSTADNDVDEVLFGYPVDQEIADHIFSGYSNIGGLTASSFFRKNEGKNFSIRIKGRLEVDKSSEVKEVPSSVNRGVSVINERRNLSRFRKISAERSIYPEPEGDVFLNSTGEGASNLVRMFLNDSTYDERIIEVKLLGALNQIMMPEAEFESIRVQQVNYNGQRLWEVFLQEKGLQRVPLSKTGSGLKTIVLVLLNLLVMPHIKEYRNTKITYGFEELENNLHPALQRRLFEFLYQYAIDNNTIMYITTHSHIAINAFFDKEEASIFHVVKNNGYAEIKCIETYIDKSEILNDLDVKASDILQSNGIIWVEGPSDRVYVKRWLELFTSNEYEEGKHYQFLYYGGRLLSHYTTAEEKELINIITTNRNAAIIIDSDKKYRSDKINDTKKRIVKEFDALNMYSWITKGKEIENYLPKNAIEFMLSVSIKKGCGQYDLFSEYIKKYYKNFSGKKVPFANRIKDYLTLDNSAGILDLKTKIEQLYKQIIRWNEH